MEKPAAGVVIVGDTEVARLGCTALVTQGLRVTHLLQPTADELVGVLDDTVDAVAVLVRGDVVALRYALLVEHTRPGVRLVVTLFDRTVGNQVLKVVPNCLVTSPADVSVPSVIAACLGGGELLAVDAGGAEPVVVRGDPYLPTMSGWSRPSRWAGSTWRLLRGQLRPVDESARTLVLGLSLLMAVLLLDWGIGTVSLHEGGLTAFYIAVRVLATVGPANPVGQVPDWYLAVSGGLMLLTIASMAIFTAGLVNRLLSPRLTSIVGRRVVPRDGHVVVIGLGQVGTRLCGQLRSLGIPVLGVEREASLASLRRLKALGVPVVVGDGSDRALLEKLGLSRARALAAMGSDDLDNVAVAIAALAVAPGLNVVLRAGDDAVVSETRSLFPIGQVRDVSALTAAAVAAALLDVEPLRVYQHGDALLVAHDDGVRACDPVVRCSCGAGRSR